MFKKISIFIGVLLAGLLFMAPAKAEDVINSFQADIKVNSDSSFTVEETITYDFGDVPGHGITRDIPYSYTRNGAKFNVRINISSVTNEAGQSISFISKRQSGLLSLRIGDANANVTGVQTYIIDYQVARAINYFSDHDELYWNVTGNGWLASVEKVTAEVSLPQALADDQWKLACYTGTAGSTVTDCSEKIISGQTVSFSNDNELSAYEGLTIVVGWPKGMTAEPNFSQKLTWFLTDNWPVAVPLLVILIMFYLWYTRGRDPRGRGTVVPQYEPPDKLPVAELGTVVDEKADLVDISATIVQLAVKGYLKIKEIEEKKILGDARDYELVKQKDSDQALRDYEQTIFKSIFDGGASRTVSSLKNKFYVNLKKIKNELYDAVVADGYFPSNPEKVRQSYAGLAVVVIILGFLLLMAFNNVLSGVATVISGIIALIFARVMPRKTKKGADIHEEIMGFKWFLSVTEKERLKMLSAPAKSPKEFEELLPYAMVLGVEKEWAKQFEGLYLQPPEWYEGRPGTAFGAWYLATALGSFSSNMNSAMVTTPHSQSSAGSGMSGFGGGGFSGGGFGGGGGGRW